VDVLIYYPFLGFHGFSGDATSGETLLAGSLPDADPIGVESENAFLQAGRKQLDRLLTVPDREVDERVAWINALQPLLQAMDSQGISWGWVNDHALQSGKVEDGNLTASGGRYGVIVLPNIDAIESSTLSVLQRMVQSGASVFLSGRVPERQPGFKDAASGDVAVREGVEVLRASGAADIAFTPQAWLATLSKSTVDPVRYQAPSAIKRYRRLLPERGEIHFFGNQSAEAQTLNLQVTDDVPLWWFDAQQGVSWPVETQDRAVALTLSGFESRFLMVGVPYPAGLKSGMSLSEAVRDASQRWPLKAWHLVVDDFDNSAFALGDWRDVDALRHARGPGVYQHEFTLQQKQPDARYLLDLGLVQGSACVKVNGVEIGRASLPPFIVDITAALKDGSNTIVIEVLAPLRNYFVGRALAGDARYSNMESYREQLVAAGLIGPIEIVETVELERAVLSPN
jgi:hypothetical protein